MESVSRARIPFQNQRPYGVEIDPSKELSSLVDEASKLKDLPFHDKMETVTKLTVGAMENAWEGYKTAEKPEERERFRKIVFQDHTLSGALKQKAGCCRHQATLFLILGAAAELGDRQYLQSSPVGNRINTCFNDVVKDGKVHHVSVFCASLKDKANDYTQDPEIFDKPHFARPARFFSYEKNPSGQVIERSGEGCHAGISRENAKMYQSWAHDKSGPTATGAFFKQFSPWTR
ncbi:MAG: hypothetical protein HRU43_03190 [Simkaniaceae bacterium]|nr:hypothetical protein [Simkaniaceae bacterium]